MGLAVKNNNPGNLKDPNTGTFRQFSTPQEGYAALLNDLQAKQMGTTTTGLGPSSTLVDFSSKYAPAGDRNNVAQYTVNLANQMGVSPTTQLKDLDLAKWAAAVAKNEDRDSIFGNQKIVETPQEKTQQAQQAPRIPEQPFTTPLHNIAAGEAERNPQEALGALKGGLQVVRETSGVDKSPVVRGMLQNAPEFSKAVDAAGEFIKPQNFSEAKGSALSQIGAALIGPGAATKSVVNAHKAATLPGKTLTAVSPRLTQKVAVSAQKTAPQGIRGVISTIPSKRTKEIADIAKAVYNPSKTFSENAMRVRGAIAQKATSLSDDLAKKDVPYIFKELQSDFNKVDMPHFIKTSDAVVKKRAKSIVDEFMRLARENDGKLDGLLKARKQFDSWVEKQYPRVFDEGGDAVQQLVRNIREVSKNFIEKRAPDVGVKASLREQSLLYDALDIFDEKAVLGELQNAGEIGSTYLSRFGQRHPLLKSTIEHGSQVVLPAGIAGYVATKLTQ